MWPFKKKVVPRRRYYAPFDGEWRAHWFQVTDWHGQGETCQCEDDILQVDRTACPIHGARGEELYETLAKDFQRWRQ